MHFPSAVKTFFRLLLQVLFRFRAYNVDALKTPGPVLLIPNHRSWLDWLFLWVCLDEDWKFVTSSISAQTSCLRHINAGMLEEAGYKVDTAEDGQAAWEALCRNHYDLLITDNFMPRLSGLDLI